MKSTIYEEKVGHNIATEIRSILAENPVEVLSPLMTNVAFNIDRTLNEQTIMLEYEEQDDSSHTAPEILDEVAAFVTVKRARRQ